MLISPQNSRGEEPSTEESFEMVCMSNPDSFDLKRAQWEVKRGWGEGQGGRGLIIQSKVLPGQDFGGALLEEEGGVCLHQGDSAAAGLL